MRLRPAPARRHSAGSFLLALFAGGLLFMSGESLPLLDGQPALQEAAAQQMGRHPWGYSRNKSLAAQFKHAERQHKNQKVGDINTHQYITSHSSTSIGNYTQIEQILEGNAQGSLDFLADQKSTGNQGANAGSDIFNSELSAKGSNNAGRKTKD